MKVNFLVFLFAFFLVSGIYAQNYQISFEGSGASTNVDFVKVENLSQCTTLDINGSDILHLVTQLGYNDNNDAIEQNLQVYPNPSHGFCFTNLKLNSMSSVTISLFDISGKETVCIHDFLTKGQYTYQISGLRRGIYILQIEAESLLYYSKIISLNETSTKPDIKLVETSQKAFIKDRLKDYGKGKNLIQMQYNSGDLLKITGKSGDYRTVYMLTPNTNQTVIFNFIPCADANGNTYSVVQIGSQWWMAENLNVGTYASITSPQVFGTKFCMDINGQADPSCPMGGLYEWENLMQGAVPCNGTGAPPNDQCANPIKGLCPNGWHIPSHYEWTSLARNSGSSPSSFPYDMSIGIMGTDEGGNLKQICTSNWWAPNAGATDLKGFSAFPGGDTWAGVFEDFGQSAYFWTSTASYTSLPWVYALNYSLAQIGRSLYVRENGFSVRCVKN